MAQHHTGHHLHKKKQKDPFDYVVYFFMIATPLFELPQAYIIHSTQNAESVSPFTWGFFLLSSVVWLTYGIKHKITPFIFMYSLYLVVEATIVTGIILYS